MTIEQRDIQLFGLRKKDFRPLEVGSKVVLSVIPLLGSKDKKLRDVLEVESPDAVIVAHYGMSAFIPTRYEKEEVENVSERHRGIKDIFLGNKKSFRWVPDATPEREYTI